MMKHPAVENGRSNTTPIMAVAVGGEVSVQ